jgi:hypothetical protein
VLPFLHLFRIPNLIQLMELTLGLLLRALLALVLLLLAEAALVDIFPLVAAVVD